MSCELSSIRNAVMLKSRFSSRLLVAVEDPVHVVAELEAAYEPVAAGAGRVGDRRTDPADAGPCLEANGGTRSWIAPR